MADINLALTAAGQALKAKIEAGNGDIPLSITRIVTASGTSDDPLNLTAVVDQRQTFIITGKKITGARTAISAVVTNGSDPATGELPVKEGYPLSQIGFYALDPDEGEVLYRISQFDNPNYVPAAKERGWTYEPTFNFVTGNASDVTITTESLGGIIFSPARPTGEWRIWLQDLGEIDDPTDTFILNTAPLDAPGNIVIEDDSGNAQTVTNMTDDPATAGENDIILV